MTRLRAGRLAVWLVATAVLPAGTATPALAQPTELPAVGIRGFFDAGSLSVSAARAFDAVIGDTRGTTLGGGVQVALRNGLFVEVSAHRFREIGERVFVHDGEVFRLGIPVRVTIQPTDVTAGYRLFAARRIVPFVGGGFGSQSYKETSDFADPGEDVRERHASRHIAAGVDVRVTRWLHVGAAVWRRWVPDAIGEAGASAAFGETDLGGTTAAFRIMVGR